MQKNLILIDDKPGDVEAFRGLIRKWALDYKVISNDSLQMPIEDTDEARNAFSNDIVDFVRANLSEHTEAILLDVLFEQGTEGSESEIPFGYSIGKQLRHNFPKIPIILFTIRGEQQDIKDATYFFSFDGYITKNEFRKSRDASLFQVELYRARKKRDAVLEEFEEYKQNSYGPLSGRDAPEVTDPVILHISDIHYGIDSAAATSALAYGSMLEALKRDVIEQYVQEGIPRPNIIVASGDITSKSSIKGYPLAKEFLRELCNDIGSPLTKSKVVLVPGNHDMNRKLSRLACGLDPSDENEEDEGTQDEYYIYRFAPFKQFFDDFYEGEYVYRLKVNEMFSVFDFSLTHGIVIVGFNSCERVDHSAKWRNHAYISLDTLQAARRYLREKGLGGASIIKIAVWHHPQLFDDIGDPSFHSEILTELAKEGFLLYLYGHIHKPFNNFQPDLYRGQGLFAFGVGTIGASAGERPPDWPRHYEVLAFDMKHKKCTVYSRQRVGNSWIPFPSFKDNKTSYTFDLP